jgi:ATP-dependent phosphoenolpyruvate carboxykinase
VLARSKASTFIVSDDPDSEPHQAIDRDEWERVSALQDAYIADQEMVQVDGYIGDDPERRVPARLLVESSNVNIAGMQHVLYFHDEEGAGEAFEPELVVVYTPNLGVPGYPDDRLIAVNLDLNVSRVFHSDYFGESKKGGLRMWNKLVYDRGGLALHAGCKIIPTDRGDRVGLIVGLSVTRPAASRRRSPSARATSRPSIARSRNRRPISRTSAWTTPERSTSSTRATPRTAAQSSVSARSRRRTRPPFAPPTSCWC